MFDLSLIQQIGPQGMVNLIVAFIVILLINFVIFLTTGDKGLLAFWGMCILAYVFFPQTVNSAADQLFWSVVHFDLNAKVTQVSRFFR